MKYMFSVIDGETNSATPEEMSAISEFNDRLRAGDHLVFAGGLAAPGTATVVDSRSGEDRLSDGAFHDSEEYVSGVWLIEAPDRDVALSLGRDASKSCNRKVEVRPFL